MYQFLIIDLFTLQLNAHSLLPKISELSITESWLNSSVTNTEIDIEGYNAIKKDRSGNGGVCVHIRDDLVFSACGDIQTEDKTLWFELLLPKTKSVIIGTVYKPPKQEDFLDNFENILSKLRSDCKTIILGDFNNLIMTKPTMWLCAQRRLRSAWASAQSDQSLRSPHEERLDN